MPGKSGLVIDTLTVGELETNCYIVWDTNTGEGIVIDPGAEASRILQHLRHHNIKILRILNTHGHIDHIGANAEIHKATGAPISIHPADAPLLTQPELNGALWLGIRYQSKAPDILIEHGDQLTVGSYNLEVIHTPGHSPGSISLWMQDLLFSGDLLFKEGVGRWDLPGGNEKQLFDSLRRVLELPETTVVYPGHGPKTTIGAERMYNPFINNGEQFI